MLELKGVCKDYFVGGHAQKVLKNVSINFRANEFAAILGPSGSGKTTLLNIIGGLDQYTSGDIKINEISTKKFRDKDWDAYRNHRIGFVFQSYNLIPHQTVLSNVKLALTLSGISKREATKRATKALEEVGLKDHINKRPSQLSGGQMQRVAIARALVNDPEILLADEPTGALDSDTSVQIMDLLKKIAEKKLVIMVTHNPELADEYATRIITLKDGKIMSDSRPYDGKKKTSLDKAESAKKQHKTKMSFFTAFGLSLKNLLTKKARTILVSVAGSIGIIGIALILAVSTGFQAYIDTIEEETLTSYPLAIQRESADVTSVLLNSMLEDGDGEDDGLVHENQVLATTLGNVTQNDLKSLRDYINEHYDEVAEDLRLIENEYSVDPLIYTVDTTGKLAQLNPNNIFSSALGGGSQFLSSYTSVYTQYERANMEADLEVLAGRLPEKYNEVAIVLSEKGKIGDLLTYSLGLHDTTELSVLMSKLLAGETVEIHNEPLALSYEDLMDIKLKLLYATDLYKYNSTYNIYEDMSGDEAYMRALYDAAEELKIVGVTTPHEGMMSLSGVVYLPDLVTHVIEKASESGIVKKQLANPEVDVFSGVKFGDESNKAGLEFSDLVSVNTARLSQAFKVNINKETIAKQLAIYVREVGLEVQKKTAPLVEDLKAGVELEILGKKYAGLGLEIQSLVQEKASKAEEYLMKSLASSFKVDERTLMSAFSLNFTEEELARMMTAMYTETAATYMGNLTSLGYQDLDQPTHISIYFSSFDGKTHFMEFLDEYNDLMRENGMEERVIEYSDTTGMLMNSVKVIVDAVSYVLIAFVSISLIVSSIMIGVITYISVYERTKEIGILRAIGASKRNISSIFNAETFIIGLLSGVFGIGISYIFIPIINAVLHHFTGDIPLNAALYPNGAIILVVLSVILTLIGGLIPAKAAAKKDPVEALRSE